MHFLSFLFCTAYCSDICFFLKKRMREGKKSWFTSFPHFQITGDRNGALSACKNIQITGTIFAESKLFLGSLRFNLIVIAFSLSNSPTSHSLLFSFASFYFSILFPPSKQVEIRKRSNFLSTPFWNLDQRHSKELNGKKNHSFF